MRRRLGALALSVGIGVAGAQGQTEPPVTAAPSILVIDREAVLLESKAGQSRLAELAEAEQALAAENRSIEGDLTREEAALAERRADMDPGAFRQEADAFDMRVTAIRDTQDAKERLLIERRQRLLEAFRQEMLPVLAEIMEERSAVVMLDRDAILIFAASADITEEVVRRLDERAAASQGDGATNAGADGTTDKQLPPASTEPDEPVRAAD